MDKSRRVFLRSASVGLPVSWAVFSAALRGASTAGSSSSDEAYWLLVKRQFPLEEGLIYMNAANVCPASRPVLDRHEQYMRDFQMNPSFQNRAKYQGMHESLRTKLATMLRTSPDEIAITRNTSEGSNIIVHGIDLRPGDEVLVTDHNHPSNLESWKVRASREGWTVKTLPVHVPARSREELIALFEQGLTERTKVVAFTHVTSTTGIRFPAKEITEVAHRRGAWVHLDGAQSFGCVDVNLKEIGCDSYSASAHKWMMGPLEAGILFVKQEGLPRIWPSIVSAGWSDRLKGARKLEVYGQRDDPRMVALESAVDFMNLIGIANVEARVRFLSSRLKAQLNDIPGMVMKTNLEPELSGGVIKCDLKHVPTKAAYDRLWEREKMALSITPYGDIQGLRFSPHIYNSREEIDRAAIAVRELRA